MTFPRMQFFHRLSFPHSTAFILLLFFCSCDAHTAIQEKEIVESPEEINKKAEDLLQTTLQDILEHPTQLTDSLEIKNAALVQQMYTANEFKMFWSSQGVFNTDVDSLLKLIRLSPAYGLFPNDYYQDRLGKAIEGLKKDTSANNRLDAAKWALADLLSTSAFIQWVKDVKVGRLLPDSVLRKDTSLQADFFFQQKKQFSVNGIDSFASSLEPANKDYRQLKRALLQFLPKANLKSYTNIKTKDSTLLPKLVYKRLTEEDSLQLLPVKNPDSLVVAKAVRKYQKWKKLKVDGKINAALIKRLNTTDKEKFVRIAITLDKYKMLPPFPPQYIWVNLPAFMMEVREGDSVALKSKIIVGKPETKTPQLYSVITDMITYPQWTIPESIIKKEILPGLQRDAGYAQKRGYSIVDLKGNEVNPYSVNWSKYKSTIPFKVVQGSGDANALGVMKFNFSNPYAVYLHDTNQRYLFEKSSRALSHGCVRVQQWKQLAYYILMKDSLADAKKTIPVDSLNALLAAKKKKVIRVRQQLPLYIRYFSCEGRDGKLFMHEDIYEEDKRIRDKLFAAK